ncbi:hypothetical protein [Halolamina sp.]|jgi:hypothetical protein|uniref:hypothetical protein n=1 Tax=Halolamina sp. TaxID=1940283 RepID=UPI000223B46D|nr:hypothetical protein Halar_1571 [halophilic archaeon DL31]
MDNRAIFVGVLLTATAIIATWFGRLPFQFVVFAGVGPFVAGFVSRSVDSKAFEGVAAIGGGYLLGVVGLAVGRYLLFPQLPFRWQIDVAITTALLATIAAVFTIPMSCVAGALLGGAGAFTREFYENGVSVSISA